MDRHDTTKSTGNRRAQLKHNISSLPNLGSHSEAMLRKAGITQVEQLAKLGAVKTYVRVKKKGLRPSLNLLYALEGALTGTHWTQVSRKERGRLLIELDALLAEESGVRS